jgi:hypothetical protein
MKMKTTTAIPAPLLPLISKTAEHAVQMVKETNMPIPDQVKSTRRPSRSTKKAALTAAQKLKICNSLARIIY